MLNTLKKNKYIFKNLKKKKIATVKENVKQNVNRPHSTTIIAVANTFCILVAYFVNILAVDKGVSTKTRLGSRLYTINFKHVTNGKSNPVRQCLNNTAMCMKHPSCILGVCTDF